MEDFLNTFFIRWNIFYSSMRAITFFIMSTIDPDLIVDCGSDPLYDDPVIMNVGEDKVLWSGWFLYLSNGQSQMSRINLSIFLRANWSLVNFLNDYLFQLIIHPFWVSIPFHLLGRDDVLVCYTLSELEVVYLAIEFQSDKKKEKKTRGTEKKKITKNRKVKSKYQKKKKQKKEEKKKKAKRIEETIYPNTAHQKDPRNSHEISIERFIWYTLRIWFLNCISNGRGKGTLWKSLLFIIFAL